MTVDELREMVKSIVFSGGLKAWGMEVTAPALGPKGDRIAIGFGVRVPDRESGRVGPIAATVEMSILELESYDRPRMLRRLRDILLHEILAHELDEGLLYKGARIFDPHARIPIGVAVQAADVITDRMIRYVLEGEPGASPVGFLSGTVSV